MACDPGLFFDAAANGYFLVCAAPIGIQADAAVTRFTLEFLCIFEQFHAHDFICRDDARQLFSGGVFTHRAHSLDADTGHQQLHQLPNLEIMALHLHAAVPILDESLASFQPVVNKLLAKKAFDRYADATEARRAILQIVCRYFWRR